MARCVPLALASLLIACDAPPGARESAIEATALAGTWRAVLASPGGDLPFTLEIGATDGELSARVRNGDEQAPVGAVSVVGEEVVFAFDWYDSRIRARLAGDGLLRGEWTKTIPGGTTRMPFTAVHGDRRRFLPSSAPSPDPFATSIAGDWAVEFRDAEGVQPARGVFRQEGDRVVGTFLTPVGDYRFLAGSFAAGRLRLSTFDGAHAFLFTADLDSGGTLNGHFWSRETYHATWTARRADPGERIVPDAWSLVGLTNDDGRFRFRFPDLDGDPVSLADPRFAGKVVLVNLFGSWCPNCNDEAPLLAEWHRRYRGRGLEVVGLAYEFTGDAERDRQQVRRYRERHGIEFPLLLAGISDKKRAAQTVPDLSAVVAYPTTVFVGRDGKVAKIHSGFSGPGTGERHDELVAELEATIEELLAAAPAGR